MRLYYSPASPFARKCRVLVREKGMLGSVEEVRVDPLKGDAEFRLISPMSQVPALVDDDGVVWTDSPLICARLDAVGGAPYMTLEGEARWDMLRREVIADGVMELGVKWRLESVRAEGERSPTWMTRWREGVLNSIAAAEELAVGPEAPLDIASIATVCALTWLDFRFPDLGWRDAGRPRLVALQEALEGRQSFRETRPA